MTDTTPRILDLGRAWIDLREGVEVLDARDCPMAAGRAHRAREALRAQIQDRLRELAAVESGAGGMTNCDRCGAPAATVFAECATCIPGTPLCSKCAAYHRTELATDAPPRPKFPARDMEHPVYW